jgi:hypothetical protein
MKTLALFVALCSASTLTMIFVDYMLGPRAEFLNAFSALERLLGREPSIPESMIASKFGQPGEVVAVLVVNLLVSGILTILLRVGFGSR